MAPEPTDPMHALRPAATIPRPDAIFIRGGDPTDHDHSRFTYDAAQDVFHYPQGQVLRRYTAHYHTEVVAYRAEAAVCNACPVKAACTTSDHGRLVHRSFHADYLDRVRGYHATAAYAKAMRKRQVWVEPLFGEAKDWHGLRRGAAPLPWTV